MDIKGKIVKKNGRVYYITWRKKSHVFRMWNSFGISTSILDFLKLQLVDTIIIRTSWGEYVCNLWDYLNSPLEYNNNGDVQKHLPLSQFRSRPRHQTLDTFINKSF